MTTRREFTQGSTLALFMAFIAASKQGDVQVQRASVPFDNRRHQMAAIGMMTSSGLRFWPEDANEAMLGHMMFGEELPEEYEWVRERCRETLYAVLDRLEGRI